MKTNLKKNKNYLYTICIVLIAIFAGCKNDSTPIPVITADFPKNTEWVGTLDGNGFQYRPPCSLRFNSDNTFTMYAIFVFPSSGGTIRKDSITGTIQAIDTLSDFRIRITTDIKTSYNGGPTKYLYITDKQKIKGISADQSVETFQLSLFPKSVSVVGHWSGIAWRGGYAYPDVSLQFDNTNSINVTHYTRFGSPVLNTQSEPTSGQLGVNYTQKGARVYFGGCNEALVAPGVVGTVIPYFGVLLPSGDKMMVHSFFNLDARLPNYTYTNEPYGPNGVTPIIDKY
jgi:hypothetical protein